MRRKQNDMLAVCRGREENEGGRKGRQGETEFCRERRMNILAMNNREALESGRGGGR